MTGKQFAHRLFALVACSAAAAYAAQAAAADLAPATVRIAYIDPLSGLMGPVGNNLVHSWQYVAELANKEHWAPGITFEIVPFDNKLSPQESLNDLKAAIDQDIHYVAQGNGTSVARALIGGISKHNERNPGKEVVFLNYAAVDPDLTNGECTFWHFRWDANSDMKMEGLTSFIAKQKDVHKVYLIDQDYAFGHQVERAAKEGLAKKRPDIEIVGDDFHPLAKVTDFSQYVAKMKAANADTVITGNWGSDLALLIKAARDAGLNANFYTYYAGTTGVPTQMGAAGAEHVRVIAYWNPNIDKNPGENLVKEFKAKYDDDFYGLAAYNALRGLANAIVKAGSIEPVKVAYALDGMKFHSYNGDIEVRATDHQVEQPLYIASWQKLDGKTVKYDQEKTGYGWRNEATLPAEAVTLPTSCQMQRPPKPN
jgi:branched-chain amino acid transport system substrate-binding protein